MLYIPSFFSAPGLCNFFAPAKMLYRRLVDEVVEIFILLHTIFFPLFVVCCLLFVVCCLLFVVGCSYLCVRQIARFFKVTTVNTCKVIFVCTALNLRVIAQKLYEKIDFPVRFSEKVIENCARNTITLQR